MKAYIHTAKTSAVRGNDPFHGHEIRLTVGMIVKNEEKNLKKCLASLKPLLDAVPSELIVTDTGSTDRTVEIAEEYADRIIHFDWCDDFSAARNTGLDAARGEWFLYLDADEWFDDVTPLIDFFNSGECDRYRSAAYIQRNYENFSGDKYSDYYACRIARVDPQIRFVCRIHECLPIVEPTKMLSCFVHHYGYVYASEEEKETKFQRNYSLMIKQLSEHPDDLKTYCQLCLQTVIEGKFGRAIEIAEKALAIPQKDTQKQWGLLLKLCLLRALFRKGDYQRVIITLEKFLDDCKQFEIFHIDAFHLAQLAALNLMQYKKAVDFGDRCLALYRDFAAHKLDESMLLYGDFECVKPEARQDVLLKQVYSEVAQKDAEKALKYLRQVNFSLVDASSDEPFRLYATVAGLNGDWGLLSELYLKMIPDKKMRLRFIRFVETNLMMDEKRRAPAVRVLAALNPEPQDGYVLLCRLRLAEFEGDRKQATAVLDSLRRSEGLWDSGYADILWYVMKEKVNILPFLLHVDVDGFPAMAAAMQTTHKDYSAVIGDYFESFSFENAKALFCSVCLLERAVLSRNAKANAEFYKKLIVAYFDNLSKFVRAEYKPEILTESGISALPGGYRFGYYAGLALDAKRQGDGPAYLANLRMGLKEYPAMKDCVGFLLKDFEDKQKKDDAQAQEFAALAVKVKQNIEQLIAQGNMEQAGVYTLQLAKLIPEDDDLRRYRKLTHTEPTMNELVTRLPQ